LKREDRTSQAQISLGVSQQKRATFIPEYVSGWCGHGFESHSQPVLLTYLEAALSL